MAGTAVFNWGGTPASVVPNTLTTTTQLKSVIEQVVGNGGFELNQDRLAEILLKMLKFIETGPSGSGVSTVTLGFDPVSRGLTVSVNGISDTKIITIPKWRGGYGDKADIELLTDNLINDTAYVSNTYLIPGGVLNTSGHVFWNGTVWVVYSLDIGGGGGFSLVQYDAGDGVTVSASAVGITAVWTAGEFLINIPVGVKLLSFHINMQDGSKVVGTADASGSTNWLRVKIQGTTGYNTAKTDMKVPVVQKTLYPAGVISLSNVASIDIDNNPNVTVVGVGSESITIRIISLIIPNGGQLTFTAI